MANREIPRDVPPRSRRAATPRRAPALLALAATLVLPLLAVAGQALDTVPAGASDVEAPYDVNGDGAADGGDATAVGSLQGLCAGDARFDPSADLDGSGCVDAFDLAVIAAAVEWLGEETVGLGDALGAP